MLLGSGGGFSSVGVRGGGGGRNKEKYLTVNSLVWTVCFAFQK